MNVLKHIINSVAYDCHAQPGASQQVSIGDCTPCRTGDCDGHPPGAHAGKSGMLLDICYYTTGPNNCTQYPYVTPGEAVTPIWDDNLKSLDWERNYLLINRIFKCFPQAVVVVDERIVAHIRAKMTPKYGPAQANWFYGRVFGDSPGHYNHDIHMHCQLGRQTHEADDINWEAEVK